MKLFISILFLLALPIFSRAQVDESYLNQLKAELKNAPNDTIRMDLNRQIGFYLQDSKPGLALPYHQAQLELAQKLQLKLWEADAFQQIAYCYWWLVNYPESYEYYMKAMKIVEDPASATNAWRYDKFSFSKSPEDARQSIIGMVHYELGSLYSSNRQFDESLRQWREGLRIGEKLQNKKILSLCCRNIGIYYKSNNQPDSAFAYYQKALGYFQTSPYQKSIGLLYQLIGSYYIQKRQFDSAQSYLQMAVNQDTKTYVLNSLVTDYRALATLFIAKGQLDSALLYANKQLEIANSNNDDGNQSVAYQQLASIYSLQSKNDLAYTNLLKGKSLSDSLNEDYITKLMQFQNIGFDQKMRLQELEKENQQTKNRTRIYALLIGLGIFLLAVLFLYRNNRQKQKTNKVLAATLTDLKATQTQLVHAEKMASLGELTAGIAHEIQNPLNFVNNFAEINNELIDEMHAENDMEGVMTIAGDIRQNNEKISEHGKRADAIVKSMLQHSRSSSGKKEPTDINALCDEYLRLAYHGLRAKDKSFNATYETHFDDNISKLNIVPQDIGRVLLNLINNAFYAVDEKRSIADEGYKPLVTISTGKMDIRGKSGIVISVKDNGGGIPEAIREKVLQPFFTTKPTGKGTGLGLSLSYEIIKAHGGELKIFSKESEGTEFIVALPD